TACAMATINALAPGRAVLGIGTGNTARRTLGMPAARVDQMREHIEICRGLLGGQTVPYHEGERHRMIKFLNPGGGFINIRKKVPIYAHDEHDREYFDPERRDTLIDVAPSREPKALLHRNERAKPDGESRQQDVPGDHPGKLKSREKCRIESVRAHGSPMLVNHRFSVHFGTPFSTHRPLRSA